MSFKKFISLNQQKTALTIFLIIFAPLPFFVPFYEVVLVGLAPPILLLGIALSFEVESGFFCLLGILFFVLHSFFAYLLTCVIITFFSGITQKKTIQWILIVAVATILVIASFFRMNFWGWRGVVEIF